MTSTVRSHVCSTNKSRKCTQFFCLKKNSLVSKFSIYISHLLHKEPKDVATQPPLKTKTSPLEFLQPVAYKPSTEPDNDPDSSQDANGDIHCDHEDLIGDFDKMEHDRRQFAAIQSIDRDLIAHLVLSLIHPEKPPHATAHVTHRVEGSFHNVAMVKITTQGTASAAPQETHYALKIPLHGTAENWRCEDGIDLRREAMLMNFIRRKCPDVPVPQVYHFDSTLDNAIGAPYILMAKLEGRNPASRMWYNKPFSKMEKEDKWRTADVPTASTEAKRITFVRSLAKAMAQLEALEFPLIGVPEFASDNDDVPVAIGAEWSWHNNCDFWEPVLNGPFASSKEFFRQGLDKAWCPARDLVDVDPRSIGYRYCVGMGKMLDIILAAAPFTWSGRDGENKESFVLRHGDTNLQNLLVADDGTLTGIIDWDGVKAMPRCVGPTAIPLFLRKDWLSDFDAGMPHLSFTLDKYRKIYAEAMAEHADARFTAKSPMYEAVLDYLEGNGDVEDLLTKVLMQIPEMQMMNMKVLCSRLGTGWPAGEAFLEEKITELMKLE